MAKIYYARVDEFWRKEEKYAYLDEKQHRGNIEWQEIQPDAKHNWLTEGMHEEFENFLPIGSKESKASRREIVKSLFKVYSRGVCSNNDAYVYNFDADAEKQTAEKMVENYNLQLDRWNRMGQPDEIEEFLEVDEHVLKWIRNTKRSLLRGKEAEFDSAKVRQVLYRPFCKQFYYYDRVFSEDIYQLPGLFPLDAGGDNLAIWLSDKGLRSPFSTLASGLLADLHLCASSDLFQCFPFYTYNEDGTNRRENITDWALEQFQSHYKDKSITKWDVFHYVYALLHHPFYRERYAANLKRELPRIPLAPDFRAVAEIGKRLAEIHVKYEQQPEYPLKRIEAPDKPLDWRVEKMKLSKDKRSLIYNDFLTLSGIPPEVFEYRLGNRSALEWIIDQYQVSTDKRSGITNDPNRPDDPQYIVRLIGQVITVSLETGKLVTSLFNLPLLTNID